MPVRRRDKCQRTRIVTRQGGRGVGKSKLFDIIAGELFGGSVSVSPRAEMEKIATRLLSPDAARLRAARLDNLKSLRFSWDELEDIIKAPIISGRRLYHGEGRRPNTLTWSLTVNGASLSRDISQRIIPIVLKRPVHSSDWERETRQIARENRWEIVAEAMSLLRGARGPVETTTRWGDGESSVLSRCTKDLAQVGALIKARQGEADAEDGEQLDVRALFAERIRGAGHDPENCRVWFSSRDAAGLLSIAERHHYATNKASERLKALDMPELTEDRKPGVRGFAWSAGEKAKSAPVTLDAVALRLEQPEFFPRLRDDDR